MCEHLTQLEKELTARGIPITFRGQAWSHNCREWVYFTCFIHLASVRGRLGLAACVVDHVNNDPKSGEELGFVCTEHHDGIIGRPRVGKISYGQSTAIGARILDAIWDGSGGLRSRI